MAKSKDPLIEKSVAKERYGLTDADLRTIGFALSTPPTTKYPKSALEKLAKAKKAKQAKKR
jgi:hypothetical protein